jgi:nitrite reductase (NADH) small subunit
MNIALQESAPTLIPQVFVNLGSVERIPLGEGREFVVEEEEIVVFRTRAGQVYALQAKCPHRKGPLADGLLGGGKVICPYHSYKFELCSGQPIGNDCEALKTYRVEISENAEILLYF